MVFLRRSLFFGERTFRKWFVSSMGVIMLFIVFGLLLYLVALYATEKAVIVAQQQSAEQTKGLIDLKLLDIKKDVSALTFNERLLSASFIKRPFTGDDYYSFHKAGEELRGIYLYGNISDIYVYYSSCGCFTNSYSLISDNQKSFVESKFAMTDVEWEEYASHRLESSFKKAGDAVYYFSPLKRNGAYETMSLAIVELDINDLQEVLLGQQSDMSYSYIVASDGELIATTGLDEKISFGYGVLSQGENFIDKNVVISKKIENAEWEYISVVPLDQYFKEIYSLRHILYGYLAICVILAASIVYAETRRRFRPILTLRKNMLEGKNKGLADHVVNNQDIFLALQQTIEGIVDNNIKLTSLLKEEKEAIYSKFFSKMIREHSKPEERQRFFQESFSMSYKHGVVVVVNVSDSGNKLGDLSLQERENIILICLNNIGKELLGESYSCFFWKFVDMTGVIWSDCPTNEDSYIKITEILEQTRLSIKTYFDVELKFSLSKVQLANSSVTAAYLQAQEIADYSDMAGKSGVICYHNSYTQLPPEWNRVDIIRAEQDFMSYMMEHNYEKAKGKLEIITGYYSFTDGISIQLLKCRMFGLINLMLNAIEMRKTAVEEQFYLEINPVQRLLQASTIQGLEKEIMGIIEAMISHYEEKDGSTENKLEYIDRYIEAHYMDQTLSVQQLAELYHFSVSYLSKVYKQQRGSGVLEVINGCRIRHAKELLIQKPELSMAQVAEQVGYSNVQTLMRIFKKLEKQTPGQYRAGAN